MACWALDEGVAIHIGLIDLSHATPRYLRDPPTSYMGHSVEPVLWLNDKPPSFWKVKDMVATDTVIFLLLHNAIRRYALSPSGVSSSTMFTDHRYRYGSDAFLVGICLVPLPHSGNLVVLVCDTYSRMLVFSLDGQFLCGTVVKYYLPFTDDRGWVAVGAPINHGDPSSWPTRTSIPDRDDFPYDPLQVFHPYQIAAGADSTIYVTSPQGPRFWTLPASVIFVFRLQEAAAGRLSFLFCGVIDMHQRIPVALAFCDATRRLMVATKPHPQADAGQGTDQRPRVEALRVFADGPATRPTVVLDDYFHGDTPCLPGRLGPDPIGAVRDLAVSSQGILAMVPVGNGLVGHPQTPVIFSPTYWGVVSPSAPK